LGGQLFRRGDRSGALRALLLVYNLRTTYPNVFEKYPRWKSILPADLGLMVNKALNEAFGEAPASAQSFLGIEELEKSIQQIPLAKRFLETK